MIRVLIVSPCWPFPEYKDGIAKIVANLLVKNEFFYSDLIYIGNEVDVGSNSFFAFRVSAPVASNNLEKISRFLFFSVPYCASEIKKSINEVRDLLSALHQNYDVIHVIGAGFALLSYFSNEEFFKKIILTPVDSIGLHFNRRRSLSPFGVKKFIYFIEEMKSNHYEKKYYKKFSAVSFVSEIDGAWCERRFVDKSFHTISNGVDIDYFKSRNTAGSSQKSVILFTGNMNYAPNSDAATFLIDEIFPRVESRYDCELYIVGANPSVELLKRRRKTVYITGFVEDIRSYLDQATVYVSPLREGSGIKNKVLEAMAMNKIVIGTPISFEGISIKNNNNCLIVEPDAGKLADSICSVIQEAHKFSWIKDNARDLIVSKYSWPAIREKYADLYRLVINGLR